MVVLGQTEMLFSTKDIEGWVDKAYLSPMGAEKTRCNLRWGADSVCDVFLI